MRVFLMAGLGATLIALVGGRRPSLAAPASGANPWIGEWSFTHGDSENGQLSIRDCLPDGSCRLILGAWGHNPSNPKQGGVCSYGNNKLPTSETNLRVLKLEGKQASARLVTANGKMRECTLDLLLDEGKQPPQIRASLSGRACDELCQGYTHLPAVFSLRSRKPYLQYETWHKTGICYADDSPAVAAWCTDDKLFGLYRGWKLRQEQLSANGGPDRDEEYEVWQEIMLDRCKAAADPGRCIGEAYEQQIRELSAQLYGRFLDQKISAEQVLTAIYPKLDPRTAKTGERTDVNTKNGEPEVKGQLRDEILVFFKIAEPSFLPGHLLVLDAVSDAFDGAKSKSHLSVLKAEGGRLVVVTREVIRGGDSPDDDTLPWRNGRSGSHLKFDLADYKINERERAFGYRVAVWGGGSSADYGTETLTLYRLAAGGAKRVLDVTMESHDAAWDNQEGKTYKDKQERLILIVSPRQHDGNYDWIVKGRIVNKRSKRSKAAKTQTFVWKNDEYALDGADDKNDP